MRTNKKMPIQIFVIRYNSNYKYNRIEKNDLFAVCSQTIEAIFLFPTEDQEKRNI